MIKINNYKACREAQRERERFLKWVFLIYQIKFVIAMPLQITTPRDLER